MGAVIEGPNLGDIVRKRLKNYKKNLSLEVGYAENRTYPDGTSVAEVAKVQEYGATINHPGGTKYAKATGYTMVDDPATGRKKRVYKVGVRFVANNFTGEAKITGPHTIVIPARPFFRTAINRCKDKWIRDFAMIFEQSGYNVETALAALGSRVVKDIQGQIDDTHEPPNAPSTIRKKTGKGKEVADHPLIGVYKLLRNALTFQVVKP